jgi:hypothetical protein
VDNCILIIFHKVQPDFNNFNNRKHKNSCNHISLRLKHRCIFLLLYFQQDATLHSLFISGKLLYIFRVVSPPIISSTHNCIYSIWYLSNRYCYLPLLWKSWNWFECGVGIVLICFPEINKLCNVSSCKDPWTLNRCISLPEDSQ